MKPRQILIHKDLEKSAEKKIKPVTLKVEIEKSIKVNICNDAEKIEEYPEAVQKLVCRALHYKCEIETRLSMSPTSPEHYEKLTKYIEAFRQTQKLILKMCRRQSLGGLLLKEVFKKYYRDVI